AATAAARWLRGAQHASRFCARTNRHRALAAEQRPLTLSRVSGGRPFSFSGRAQHLSVVCEVAGARQLERLQHLLRKSKTCSRTSGRVWEAAVRCAEPVAVLG